MFDLTGKTALVTGATQGIGFGIAKLLAEHGAKVFVGGARNMEKCRAACREIPNSVPVCADLCDPNAAEILYEVTGDVDILVLNASMQYKADWDSFTLEQFDTLINCNVKSSYLLIQKYAPAMKNKGWGRIVTLGSCNQYKQHAALSLYGVTKAAQMKMVNNYAPYLAPYGVTINNVAPGAIATPRNASVVEDDALRTAVEKKIPCGRFGTVEEIAPAVLLLCSNEGAYITGTDLIIDGGLSLSV